MDNRPIGIFDSGIGGLTVLRRMKEILPNEYFIYLGDTLNFPYGEKSKEKIIKYSQNNIEYLIKQNVKMIVIACGTATSQALEEMRKIFDIPIFGIIDPTVEYLKEMNLQKIGILATTGTIKSGAWEKQIKKKIPNIEVINKACPLLASIAEDGKAKTEKSLKAVHEYVKIFKKEKVNTLILGCTHYPVYDEIIQKEFSNKAILIDTGIAVAKKVKRYLLENNLSNCKKTKMSKIVITKNEKDFNLKAKNILKSTQMLDITTIN